MGLWVVLLLFVLPRAHAIEKTSDRPIIPSYERFFAGDDRDEAAAGWLLLGELSCTACHSANPALAERLLTKQAPILDDMGSRLRPEFVRAFLADPRHVKPGTTMPDMFAGVSSERRTEQVEALTHFLASTGELLEAAPITPAIRRGEKLFHEVGCVACHNPRREGAPVLATSAPLPTELEVKYTLPSLAEFLKDPLHARPSGRMPSLNLSDQEARDVSAYLLRKLEVEGSIEFAYYEGSWNDLPDFEQLTPVAVGKTASFDVNLGRADRFGLVFRALVRVPKDGNYTFHLASDDGSRLWVDGREVLALPGIHAMTAQSAKVPLEAGEHTVRIEYFEQGGEQELQVEIQGGGLPRQMLEYALVPTATKAESASRFRVDQELAQQGQQLFGALGCASCHPLRQANAAIVSRVAAKPLAELVPHAGCLATAPHRVPDFRLDERQRAAMAQALAPTRADLPAQHPESAITATLLAFNCYACHSRGERGGVETARNAFFQSDQPEMGDEGRLPPPLTGVGAKLQPAWVRQVFDNGAKDRPYMFTRMPRYGLRQVGDLIELFAKADPTIAEHGVATNLDARHVKAAGRKLVGSQGFSCIKCHRWGNVAATGIQSINLQTMTRRLQENWFHQYMLDPQQYRPGTRMPAAWPGQQVLLPDVLDGQAMTQIHAVWEYLRDGNKAAPPVGLGANPIVLAAQNEAIIYRNFIEGAGTRAIGVAYPEQVNQAFDANNLRIALLWHGAFIDASQHWVGRGAGFQTPLGDNVLKLPEGVSFAVLDEPHAPWPTHTAKELGYQFGGYHLGQARRPTFRYRVHHAWIEDELAANSAEEFAPVQRTLTVTAAAPVANLWFRAATGSQIETSDGYYVIDGSWRVRVANGTLRTSNGRTELLVPVRGASATLVLEYVW